MLFWKNKNIYFIYIHIIYRHMHVKTLDLQGMHQLFHYSIIFTPLEYQFTVNLSFCQYLFRHFLPATIHLTYCLSFASLFLIP